MLALKKCIGALNEGADYVPYQDSKLTMLLSAAIGGDSKATVLICASPENNNAVETLQALRFGEMCRQVENQASNNASAIEDIIAAMDTEIETLETTIRAKERWYVESVCIARVGVYCLYCLQCLLVPQYQHTGLEHVWDLF